ncbi:MAG: hypothetical protein GXO79_11140 [Chlorobi bacterium]|nr:hypothetical protein [Chlorobiota bacterium]
MILVFGLIFFATGFSQEDSIITEIRSDFQKWQSIIDKEFDNSDKFYNYVWGENYQFDNWFDIKIDNDSLTLSEAVSIIDKKDLGYFVYVDYYSFSGDWYIAVDYYYNKEGQLYFIFWRMNTFYAEEPLTVEKRLYFDNTGQLIRDLKFVYKMNTKEKIDISFMDREVDYKLSLTDMDFYKYWKLEK